MPLPFMLTARRTCGSNVTAIAKALMQLVGFNGQPDWGVVTLNRRTSAENPPPVELVLVGTLKLLFSGLSETSGSFVPSGLKVESGSPFHTQGGVGGVFPPGPITAGVALTAGVGLRTPIVVPTPQSIPRVGSAGFRACPLGADGRTPEYPNTRRRVTNTTATVDTVLRLRLLVKLIPFLAWFSLEAVNARLRGSGRAANIRICYRQPVLAIRSCQ